MCSSNNPAIEVEHVSKFFEIYRKPAHRLLQMICRGKKQFYEPYWALQDINFTVNKGDCLGIVGRNGAGKSTLLQIIAGTLAPSLGTIRIDGRVAALLELGSGFNPDFTGRENVYLNASILGLSSAEINERFDSIAAFADIGDFIDQPVKSYSSGMTVRLAFSVIAHVDADILIIDEALAVGDAFFTQKCMRFLRSFIEAHTVLFVSHDTAAVKSLCNKAILLENGSIKQQGTPKEITETYLKDLFEARQGASQEDRKGEEGAAPAPLIGEPGEIFRDMRSDLFNSSTLRNDIKIFQFNRESNYFGAGGARIVDARLLDSQNRPLCWIVGGEPVILGIDIDVNTEMFSPIVGFFLKNRYGQDIFGDNTFLTYQDNPLHIMPGQKIRAKFSFVMPILEKGDYSISIAIAEGTQQEHVQHDWKHDALMLQSIATSCSTGLVGIPMRKIDLEII